MGTEQIIDDLLDLNILKESTLFYIESDKNIINESLNFFQKYFKNVIISNDENNIFELFSANQKKIDIILFDLDFEKSVICVSKIRELTTLPLILTTKQLDFKTLEKVIHYRIADYIIKPIKYNTTIKILNNILVERYNIKLIKQQKKELEIYKDILDKENLISETDLKGNIIYANDIFCEVSGYTKEELIGQPHNIVRHPDNSSKIFENIWETIQSGNVWKGKIKNKAKDGSSYYIKSTIFPIFDEEGNIKKYVASRFLITQDEEEKQTLKRYILQQKSQKVRTEQEIEQKYQDLLKEALESKDKKISSFVSELQKEIKILRGRINDDKGRILNLEHKLKDSENNAEKAHDDFLEKISKLRTTTRISYEKYEKFKKLNDNLKEKLLKAQESIKVYQEYIDEYRHKIDDLNDVIKSYEDDKKKAEAAKK
ncbi:hypothetical protein CP985_10765 [Malaciobacter mytili LMG 24559]|uniref:PAS sensor-containing response regulator n=1 Tax=Malaciobacter mytili LMG 24559 TaxID=1032238 RepID=A0AAX2AHT5_9BACT|nr:PAS domain-containing protein [Malaciobacter mytili]AXH15002.1 PAS sensor-containing two-component system response regulator [Malaciobacter mytili LMG 24559]RXK15016.1 hypothetical protein CP985_10765 [Malaciobacter mytili LMG 24559]